MNSPPPAAPAPAPEPDDGDRPGGQHHRPDREQELPDGRPRRTSGLALVLLAVGTFFVALALLLPFFVYPHVARQPADPAVLQVQSTTDGSALIPDLSVPAGARVESHIPITITTYIGQNRGQYTTPGNVAWQLATRVVAAGHLLQARVEDVSLDERTAEPSNCCGDSLSTVQDDPAGVHITHTGLVTFPFGVKKHSYRVWDVNLNHSRKAVYSGTSHRNGMLVYKYTATNDWAPVGTQDLPGALFGLKAPSVRAVGQYADRRTYFVEPVTGATLGIEENLNQRYVYAGRSVTALSALLESPSLDAHHVSQTRQGAKLLPWLHERASIVLVVLALLLFAAAARLLRRRAGRTA